MHENTIEKNTLLFAKKKISTTLKNRKRTTFEKSNTWRILNTIQKHIKYFRPYNKKRYLEVTLK